MPAAAVAGQPAPAQPAGPETGNGAGDYHLTPAVRMLVREHGVRLSEVTGSGIGGRITKTLAEYLFTHLHMVRPGISLMPEIPALWPQYLLNMGREDVLVIFDVRRYDRHILDLARLAKSRGAAIILFTDQWMSPISALARHSLNLRIDAPSRPTSAKSVRALSRMRPLVASASA